MNNATETVFGWKPEELVGSSTRALYRSDEEYEEIARHFYPLLEKQQSYTEEFPCRRKDGRDIVCRISASKIGETLKEKGIVVIYEDITEKKQAEITLMESENKFKNLVEGSIAGVSIVQDDVLKYVNKRFAEIHGYAVEEIVDKLCPKDLALPDDWSIIEENRRKLTSGKTEVAHYEYRIVGKDKKIIHLEIYASLIMYQGKLATTGTLRDVTERKHAEEELLIIKKAVESASDAIGMSDPQGHHFYQNKSFTNLFEYTAEELEAAGGGPVVFSSSDTAREVFDAILNGRVWSGETEVISKSGRRFPVFLRADVIKDDVGRIISILGTFTDITERKKSEEALQESEVKFRSLFEESRDAIYITGRGGKFIDANKAFLDLFGETKEGLMERNAKDAYTSIEDKEGFKKMIREQGAVRDYEIKLQKKDGTKIDCLITVTPKQNSRGDVVGYQGIVRDITERKKTEDLIKHLAYHDYLTGLPNRLLFNDRLSVEIARASRHHKRLAVMMLDLDRFKDVNDTLGHDTGDVLLKGVAEGLTKLLRKSDTVARLGGDEFILILTELNQIEDASVVADNIIDLFQKPFQLSSHIISITTSIGIAVYPEDAGDSNTLVKNADTAMYRAKQAGRNNYQWYSNILKNN